MELRKTIIIIFSLMVSVLVFCVELQAQSPSEDLPNILFIISDDQGYPHASAYGETFVETPVFDRIAQEGILFTNFFVSAPQCSPSRASILTGRHIWQNGPAGTHWSTFPAALTTYTDVLKNHGYALGYTGKGWAPGNWIDGGRTTDPVGIKYFDGRNAESYAKSRPASGISTENYVAGFELFLDDVEKGEPFCFWMGGWEPHLPYEKGSGLKNGKSLSSVILPSYLPDAEIVRSDLLDYALEIEWFDKQAGRALDILEERGMLENTLVIFTSDNGMPFPRAKAFSFDDGNHVPFAVMWKGKIVNPGRTVDDLISAVDLFPTFLEAAGIEVNIPDIQGKSLLNIFQNGKSGKTDDSRRYIFWGRERHGSARWSNLGYPQRAIRSDHYLYIWNPKPERYPAGSPKRIRGDTLVWDYGDVGTTPTKAYMIERQGALFEQAFGKFPEEMLYDIREDPFCIYNLADDSEYREVKEKLSHDLRSKLKENDDPRVGDDPDIWESYRRYGPMKQFPRPEWADSLLNSQVIRR